MNYLILEEEEGWFLPLFNFLIFFVVVSLCDLFLPFAAAIDNRFRLHLTLLQTTGLLVCIAVRGLTPALPRLHTHFMRCMLCLRLCRALHSLLHAVLQCMNPKSELWKLVLAQEPYSGVIRYKFYYKDYIVDFYSTEQVLSFVSAST